ncbi:MAG: glycosyltransferase family 2 protein, partial [Promethearchaeota archaeon]
MNHKPKISIIIPTYNEEINIKNTLIAIKRQKCNIPYEIVVVDGQSSDNTVSISEKFAKVYISPEKGKSAQLNYVVPKSSGELLIFLDADTLIDEYFIQKIYNIFEKHKNLFACSARVKYYDGKAIKFKLGSQIFTITN